MRPIVIQSSLIALVISMVIASGLVLAHGDFHGDQQYGAVGCHDQESPVIITMVSSPATSTMLQPGQALDVWVNVTGEITGQELGTLIASTTNSYGSLPTENGWTILIDPGGSSQYNYWNDVDYDGGASFHWSLEAPSGKGSYPLYALVVHAGDELYSKAAGPLMFSVGETPEENITVSIIEPSRNEIVSGNMQVTASIIIPNGSTSVDSVDLIIDGAIIESRSHNPYSWSIDTKDYENGLLEIEIVAHDSLGIDHSGMVNVTVDNEDLESVLGNLGMNITAGVLASLAFISFLTLLVLWARDHLGGGK